MITLDKVAIDIGKDFSEGLIFVACSRVCHLLDIMFDLPFTYQHVKSFGKSVQLTECKVEGARVCSMEHTSFPS